VQLNAEDVGLLDAEDFSGFGLGKGTALMSSVNLQRQLCFSGVPVRVGKAEVGEDVPLLFFHAGEALGSRGHVSCAFSVCCSASARRRWMRSMSFLGVAMPFFDFFWKAWRTIDRLLKADCIDGAPRVAVVVYDNLKHRPSAEAFEWPCRRVGFALLGGVERLAIFAPNLAREAAQVSSA